MEESLIFDLLESKKIGGYREKLKKSDNGNLSKWVLEAREELEKRLNEEQMKLEDKYKFKLNLLHDYIVYESDIRILNYGIKMGMQLQKSFDDDRE